MVYGGESVATGAILDDLWVLDLTNAGILAEPLGTLPLGSEDPSSAEKICPWHEILPSGSAIGVDGGVMDGGMVYVPLNREFVLVGGVKEASGTRWTTGTVATLGLDDLGDGTAGMTGLADLDYASANMRVDATGPLGGGPWCSTPKLATCWNVEVDEGDTADPSDDVVTCTEKWSASVDLCTNSFEAPDDCSTSGVSTGDVLEASFPGCTNDPYCLYDAWETYLDISGPGIAGAGVAYDPVSDDLRALGGYSGCRDGACDAWSSAYVHGQEGGTPYLRTLLAAHDASIDSSTGGVTPRESNLGAIYSAATGWPAWVTRGVSGVAATVLGLEYDHLSREHTRSGTARFAYVGGSVWREAAIIQEHLIDRTTDSGECSSWDVFTSAGWDITQSAASLDDGILDATAAVGTIIPSATHTWTSIDVAGPTPGSRRDAAVTAIDADRILVVGGQGGEGEDDILLIDTSSGAVAVIDEATDRYGATVSYDPIAGVTLIFGGRDSSTVTIVEVDDDPTSLTDGSTWEMGTSAVTMTQDTDALDTWLLEQTFTATHSCEDDVGGAQCGAALATLYLPTVAQADLETLDVLLEYEDGLVVRPRVVAFGQAEESSLVYAIQLRLPRVVGDGEALEVNVTYDAHAEDVGRLGELRGDESTTRGLKTFAFGDDQVPAWQLNALPAWWSTGGGFAESVDQRIQATWAVDPVGDYVVVGTGQLADPTALPATLSGGPAAAPIDHTVMVLDGVDYVGDPTPSTLGTLVHAFIDRGMDTAHSDAVSSYATEGVPLELDYLETRLGEHPLGYGAIVYLRQPSSATSTGIAFHGYQVVCRVSDDGTLWADGADGDDGDAVAETTVHELAHGWLGTAVWFDHDQTWLKEGLVTFLASSRHVGAWVSRNDSVDAAATIVEAVASGDDLGLESAEVSHEIHYAASSYIILQAWLLHVADGGTDDDFWSALRTTTSALSYGEEVSEAALESLLDGWAGFTGFYNTFVEEGELSLPMVALTELDLPADSSDTGDTGISGSAGKYTILQAQAEMYSAAAWSAAPYVLACSDADDDTTRAFDECHEAHPGYSDWELVPGRLTTETLSGTPSPAAGAGALRAVSWTMYAGPYLLSSEGSVQLRKPLGLSKLLRCTDAAVSLECLTDTDSDGHVDQGDCDADDPSVHPLWMSYDEAPCSSTSLADYNCDGWSCPN